jgi:intracellular sulfur oxidation DsrE/DsrF family protein
MRIPQFTLCVLFATLLAGPALADNDGHGKGGNNECPVGLVKGLTLDEEFGPGAQELTRCLKKRHDVKMVVQINQLCASPATATTAATCSRPFALGNIANILDDYETTHGMKAGKDYELVAVIHSGGGILALKNDSYNKAGELLTGRNKFESTVKELMERGVKFYFCQNTTRGYIANGTLPDFQTDAAGHSATGQIIEGMQYSTAGLTTIADLEALGYQYIQP